ncbi:MAG: DUF6580 family putative transport protein [Bryobacteraceae bacterium]
MRPVALGLTILSGVARLLPHPPNFTPVGSMSLFAGARIPGWLAYLLPLVVMAVTDPLVGGYTKATALIYFSFLISVWIGRHLRKSDNPIRIGAAAFLCSLQFFLITNFAVWLGSRFYPQTFSGLLESYASALPFFGRTLAGDLFFTAVLFGLHAWLSRTAARPESKSSAVTVSERF